MMGTESSLVLAIELKLSDIHPGHIQRAVKQRKEETVQKPYVTMAPKGDKTAAANSREAPKEPPSTEKQKLDGPKPNADKKKNVKGDDYESDFKKPAVSTKSDSADGSGERQAVVERSETGNDISDRKPEAVDDGNEELDEGSDLQLSGLPLPHILGYLSLSDVLQFRLASQEWRRRIEGNLSPETYALWLRECLQTKNLYLAKDTSEWTAASQTSLEYLNGFLTGQQESSRLTLLLRTLRVASCVPTEAAVAFSAQYGRHCIPLEWSPEDDQLRPIWYKACRRPSCSACQVVVPWINGPVTTNPAVGYSIEQNYSPSLLYEHKKYFLTCCPNLPADLCCPVCRVQSKRTLMLSELSYQSSEVAPTSQDVQLTFTPRQPQDWRKEGWQERLCPEDSFPPALYRDVSIPGRNFALQHEPDAKHCLSIHCDSCYQFALFAPVDVCHHDQFLCRDNGLAFLVRAGRHPVVWIPSGRSTVGAIFVRRQCSQPDCNKATFCGSCSRSASHLSYDYGHFVFKSRCDDCNLILCQEHAWLSTVCHHS